MTLLLWLCRRYEMTIRERELLEQYPLPDPSVITSASQALHEPSCSRDSYRDRMHTLLYIEEMAQFSSIAM